MKFNQKQIYSIKCYVALFLAGVVCLLFFQKVNVFIFWFVISVVLLCSIAILSNSENISKSETKIDSIEIVSFENQINNKSTRKLKFWKLWIKSTICVYVIGCFIGYTQGIDALSVAIGSY